jgi:hypothetical protein
MSSRIRTASIQAAAIVLIVATLTGAQAYFDTLAVATAAWRVLFVAALGALLIGVAWLTDEQGSAAQIAKALIERARRK